LLFVAKEPVVILVLKVFCEILDCPLSINRFQTWSLGSTSKYSGALRLMRDSPKIKLAAWGGRISHQPARRTGSTGESPGFDATPALMKQASLPAVPRLPAFPPCPRSGADNLKMRNRIVP